MMTRETKIGLLVGLAFLLVVGILLSEHITGSNERPAAPLADAGRAVRNGMSAPGAAVDEPAPAEPTQPVPTAQDLTPKPAPVTQVTINVPAGQAPAVIEHTPVAPVAPVTPVTPAPVAQQTVPPTVVPTVVVPSPTIVVHNPAPTDPFANDPIRKLAEKAGEAIVPVNGVVTPASDTSKPTTTAAREYKAAAGDTLSRLAGQLPGGNVKANREAVVALNPTLQKDPNKVIVGRTYLLPTVAAKPATQTTVIVVKADEKKTIEPKPFTPKVEAKETKVAEAKTVDVATRVYVVKAGDTLSKIASNELGSKSELPQLRTLNADVLKGTDVIKVNMKLKLPAKAIASASMR